VVSLSDQLSHQGFDCASVNAVIPVFSFMVGLVGVQTL
jgi:hypothetical protein